MDLDTVIMGDLSFLKHLLTILLGFGKTGKMYFAVIALCFYIAGNIYWIVAVKNGSGLTKGAVIFSVVSALLAIAIGVIFYKEHLSTVQIVGIVLGFLSMFFILK